LRPNQNAKSNSHTAIVVPSVAAIVFLKIEDFMSLILAKGHQVIYEEEDIIAVRQNNVVEIYANDGEFFYGTIPFESNATTVKMVMSFYARGKAEGKIVGRSEVKSALRYLIGIND
jgi:hypothetical protein